MKGCRGAEHLSQDWAVWIRIPSPGESMDLMAAHAHGPCGCQEVSDASKSSQGKKNSSFSNTPKRKHLRVGHPQARATPRECAILQGIATPALPRTLCTPSITYRASLGLKIPKKILTMGGKRTDFFLLHTEVTCHVPCSPQTALSAKNPLSAPQLTHLSGFPLPLVNSEERERQKEREKERKQIMPAGVFKEISPYPFLSCSCACVSVYVHIPDVTADFEVARCRPSAPDYGRP